MRITDLEEIFAERKPKPYGTYHYFSVLVPLVQKDGTLHLLFEIRADGLKRQPGEVCFPGGKLEKGETPAEGAIRETSEELNIPEDKIRIISELDYIYTYSNFTLYSFLGVIDHEEILKAQVNQDEVKAIFLVPLDFFLENDPYVTTLEVSPLVGDDFPYDLIKSQSSYNWRKGRTTIPIYNYEGNVIWGLTGKIIQNMVRIIRCQNEHEHEKSSKKCQDGSIGG
jgi:peroxisomal coenzyme A diphosphatase NUDT7